MQTNYDYILIGGGLAGRSLAYHLLQSPLRNKRIALIDPQAKSSDDRTWCFWERDPGPFEEVVSHRWDELQFYSPSLSETLSIAPYVYKMIRGLDFYQYTDKAFDKAPQLTRIQEKVEKWETRPNGKVQVSLSNGQTLLGDWGFSSFFPGSVDKEQYNYLDQHFKGWLIQTPHPAFDPAKATFMDFRVPQDEGLSFLYVLPVSADRALVELTFFSNRHFSSQEYDARLRKLIPEFVTTLPYEVTHSEMGSIPMTDYPFPRSDGKVIFIGTAGGHTKASSGYTFWRLQRNLLKLVSQLEKKGSPLPLPAIAPARFGLFDSTMLHILEKGSPPGADLFADLFRHAAPDHVLKFLNEETTWKQDLKIMSSLPMFPFFKAFVAEVWKRMGFR